MSYFPTKEFKCPCCGEVRVSGYLVHLLNKIREVLGKAMIVNSGYRCKEHNMNTGGRPNSAHLRGTAADIKCRDSHDRYIIVKFALHFGFNRIGVYDTFIHLDVDNELPSEVLW